MGWRTDFKKTVITALKGITDIGYVGSKWTKDPIELPALIVSLAIENYGREMDISKGVTILEFEIQGKVKDLDDPDEAKEDLLDDVIEKIEGITKYVIILEDTDFHDKVEGGGSMFTLFGHMIRRKDYSAM